MKKLLCLLLVLCLCTALLAGCAKTENAAQTQETQEPQTQTAADAPTADAAEAAPTADAAEAAPTDAAEAAPAESVYPLVTDGQTLTMYATATTQVLNVIENLNNHQGYIKAEEITGVHIEIDTVPSDQGTEKLALLVASGDYPDLFRGGGFASGDLDAYENEVIIDLTDDLEEYAPNYYALIHSSDAIGQNVCTDEGYHLSFYRLYQENGGYDSLSVTQGLLIRDDLLSDMGASAPTDLDEIESVLDAFTNDYHLSDAMLLQGSITTMGDSLCSGFGIGSGFYVDGQTVCYGPLQEAFKDYLSMLARWYKNSYLNVDFYGYTGNVNDDTITSKILTTDGVGIYFDSAANLDARNGAVEEGMAYTGLANPTGPDGENHFGLDANVVKGASYYVSAQCENPELAVQWNDFWYSDQGILLTNYGIEDLTFTYDASGEPQWTDYITSNPDGWAQSVCRQAFLMYTVHGVCINDNELHMLSDSARSAVELWTASSDRAGLMPSVSYTSDESSRRAELLSDIGTLNEEIQLKLVVGELDVDAYWDTYMQQLRDMGIDEVLALTQAAADRFYSR